MSHLLTLHDPSRARENYLAGVWQTDTFYSLARKHASERPNAYALRDGAKRITWSELASWVDAVASGLHEAGLRSGDRVSIWLPNRVESVIIFLACSRQGYVCNPSLHQNYTVAEVVGLLERIECKAFVTQVGYGADAKSEDIFSRSTALGHMKRVYALNPVNSDSGDCPPGTYRLPDSGALDRPLPPASTDPDQIVYLAFTSGTTGLPKGVMHSDNTLLSNGRALVSDWGQGLDTVLLTLSPMSHHIGTVALEQSLVSGCELVMFDPARGVSALEWIEHTCATYVMGVPTHAMDLLQSAEQRGVEKLGAVTVFYMAGSPIPTEVARRLLSMGAKPQNVYGMTENGSHQYTLPGDSVDVITSTCGKSCIGYEVRLWNQENPDYEVESGDVGEIGGRGGTLMLGYFNSQTATERSFNSSGWFLSGDLGQLDENGNLRIVGRKKDLIIRGGHNIHPAHIEEYAHRHEAVKAAAAFGVPDERLGEKVCLAVMWQGQSKISPQALLHHLAKEGLSKFDMPEYLVSVEQFPLTASGKILKRELMSWVASGRLQPESVRFQAPATLK